MERLSVVDAGWGCGELAFASCPHLHGGRRGWVGFVYSPSGAGRGCPPAWLLAQARTRGRACRQFVVSKPDSENAKAFREIGERVWAKLEASEAKAMPKILVQ